jgi:DNA-binding CsgD family transcriptional regulator
MILSTFDEFRAKVQKRALPGILLFTQDGELRYINRDGLDLLSHLSPPVPQQKGKPPPIPKEIILLCQQTKGSTDVPDRRSPVTLYLPCQDTGSPSSFYYCRAFPLNKRDETEKGPFVMVLLEKISLRGEMPWKKIQEVFNLTRREIDILRLLFQGKSDKEMAEELFVSVYTIKDHLGNIRKKMQVSTRTRIITKVLEASQ